MARDLQQTSLRNPSTQRRSCTDPMARFLVRRPRHGDTNCSSIPGREGQPNVRYHQSPVLLGPASSRPHQHSDHDKPCPSRQRPALRREALAALRSVTLLSLGGPIRGAVSGKCATPCMAGRPSSATRVIHTVSDTLHRPCRFRGRPYAPFLRRLQATGTRLNIKSTAGGSSGVGDSDMAKSMMDIFGQSARAR